MSMENNIKEINRYLNSNFDILRYSNIRLENNRYYDSKMDKKYDKYTLEQFLVLYKLDYLKKCDIISKDTYKTLKKLYILKLKLSKELARRFMLDDDNRLDYPTLSSDEINEKIKDIDEVLFAYNLLDMNINIDEYIQKQVQEETYPKSQDLKKLYKDTKK